MKLNFTKMHGLGNDFVMIDCRAIDLPDLPLLAKKMADRRFGIGADQILLLYNSDKADFMMKILNADGSEVEMCGNGIRCFAKYIWDRGLSDKEMLDVETLAGIIRPKKAGDMVRVDMGEPIFDPELIPVKIPKPADTSLPVMDYPLTIDNRNFTLTFVSMGNPHAVIFIDEEIKSFRVQHYGPMIENHSLFPKRTNVEFIQPANSKELHMRVWERGSGETLACGTGASAAGVAAMAKGLTERIVTLHLTGGDLLIEWAADNHVYMTGPATEVFQGVIEL
ncbi:MAG: diaminopimelate epimerase [Dissulfurispiraceae bacterium]|jgi:diaminopimelate epimerase|nr:diaminopimelate epimerase [Dissulfurispiraceae bacterium]